MKINITFTDSERDGVKAIIASVLARYQFRVKELPSDQASGIYHHIYMRSYNGERFSLKKD